jgi:integrase
MSVAYSIMAKPPGGRRTWTVVDDAYRTVAPVEEWLEAHRAEWSPNTVRSYATALAQWWSFLEQRGETGTWRDLGVPAVSAYLSWLRNGRSVGRLPAAAGRAAPQDATLESRLAALISFYRWQNAVHEVPVAKRLLRGTPRRIPVRGLLAHLNAGMPAASSSLVRVRKTRCRDRPPILLPQQIQAILDGCAVWDEERGEWAGNLRDRFLFSVLADSGMRIGEALGLRINDFVMGRGATSHLEVVPREDNANGARVKMMRARRVYVGADLERLYADYLTHLALRAAELGLPLTPDGSLFVNLERPPFLAALREGTVRDKVDALRRRGLGPVGWTAHWFRHSHATALLLAGTPDWVVSRRLGHAHVQTTLDLYGWVSEDEALRAAANWKAYAAQWQAADDR